MKNHNPLGWILPILIVLTTVGCSTLGMDGQDLSLEERRQTDLALTERDGTLEESNEQPAPVEDVFQTQPFPLPEVSTQTITLSPGMPMVSVNANTICRTGPGKVYDNVGVLEVGEQAEVVGRSGDWEYWIIKNPDQSGECWLWFYYATVVGSKDELPVYSPPPMPSPTSTSTPSPTATPVFVWAGNWSVSTGAAEGGSGQVYDMRVTVVGDSFTGSVDYMGNLVTYRGRISDDLLRVSGTWSDLSRGGLFRFYALGVDRFQGYSAFGNINTALCGWRGGARMPSPCYRE